MRNTEWPQWGSLSPELAIQRREDAAVGKVVFVHDSNNRVYTSRSSGPEPRHHFVPREIVGETRVSWLVGWANRPDKFPKKDPIGLFGLLDVEDALWVSSYRYQISRRVEQIRDVDALRSIAKLIGFSPDAQS